MYIDFSPKLRHSLASELGHASLRINSILERLYKRLNEENIRLGECSKQCDNFIKIVDHLIIILKLIPAPYRTTYSTAYYTLFSILDRLLFDFENAWLDCMYGCQELSQRAIKEIDNMISGIQSSLKQITEKLLSAIAHNLCNANNDQENCESLSYIAFPTPLNDIGNMPEITRCLLKGE